MNASEPRRPYAVVILNWNGADDTSDCLASVLATSPGAVPLVIDNGSSDGSVARIQAALQARGAAATLLSPDWQNTPLPPVERGHTLIAALPENLGFAAGANVGLRLAAALGLPTCVFLNNDTVIEGDALERIVGRLGADCFVALPMLTVHGTDRVWNCGGSVSALGFRRYFHAGARRGEVDATQPIRCSFFTGCCFAVRTADFSARGGFSERFFFGEEDFELGLWMKARGLVAWCLPDAVVQHKVSVSFARAATSGASPRLFVYYLNRLIHMRLRMGRLLWSAWLAAYLPYTACLLFAGPAMPRSRIPAFLSRLVRNAARMDAVGRSDFEAIMRGGEPGAAGR